MNRDYILRIIEQFVQALVAIITARKAEHYEEALHQIQNASQRYLQTDMTVLLEMSPDQILEHFKGGTKYLDTERAIVCADLIYEMALICEAKQYEDLSEKSRLLCLNLYLNVLLIEKEFRNLHYTERVKELIKTLENRTIPGSVKHSIFIYQKSLG